MSLEVRNLSFSYGEHQVLKNLSFTASYDSPTETVIAALTEAADHPLRLQDEELFVKVSDYKDSAIEYVVRVWVKNADYWTVHFDIVENVKKVFDAKGVIMTYPHTIVHLEK